MYMYIHTCTCIHVHIYMYIHTCTYIHVHTYMYIQSCTYIHACTMYSTEQMQLKRHKRVVRKSTSCLHESHSIVSCGFPPNNAIIF